MKKFALFICIILFVFGICACSSEIPTITEPTQSDITKPIIAEIEYEEVSRPVKNFWIIGDFDTNVLVLTEAGELYCGAIDIADPIFITDNVKDVKMSSDSNDGLILLNNGKIILINNRYADDKHLSIRDCILNNSIADLENATYDTNADHLFNYFLYVDPNNNLMNLSNDVIINKKIKDGYFFKYKTNNGASFSAVFLLDDGSVEHHFNLYGDLKIRKIATNVSRLYCEFPEEYTIGTFNRCCLIKENGDLLCWQLDEYNYENDPLQEIKKISDNASPNFPVYYTSDYVNDGNMIIYVNNNNDIVRYYLKDGTTEILASDVKEIYYNAHLDTSDSEHNLVILTNKHELRYVLYPYKDEYAYYDTDLILENVIGLTKNGKYVIYDDYCCARLDNNSAYWDRMNNVMFADSSSIDFDPGRDDQQIFLKYGGALYASKGNTGTIYKTAFCETTVNLYFRSVKYTPKQTIQINNNTPMLPYDELCELLNLTAILDQLNNAITIENGESTIELYIDTNNALVNEKTTTLPTTLFTDSDGKIWVPIQIVAETFGYSFDYSSKTATISINQQ